MGKGIRYTDEFKQEAVKPAVFFAVGLSYCQANNVDVSPEVDSGSGQFFSSSLEALISKYLLRSDLNLTKKNIAL